MWITRDSCCNEVILKEKGWRVDVGEKYVLDSKANNFPLWRGLLSLSKSHKWGRRRIGKNLKALAIPTRACSVQLRKHRLAGRMNENN